MQHMQDNIHYISFNFCSGIVQRSTGNHKVAIGLISRELLFIYAF